ncbi:methyl-accepting chemotaxis protein [Paenibacillus nanensis]|uniref:Methyl-accepting chemotaxis protein n=1 Tax=Paenibacillus nanensis TaxID=393251 RepID=A0A3A1UW77_9BACL|nr:methyl-accepting chemotaxis protein [Paenibacillus nanensis]RIX51442.1 methyl-accepting chemotaxis protein [Paenibacillus nanensis]
MDVKREVFKKLLLYLLKNFLQGAVIGVAAVVLTNLIFGSALFSAASITCIILVGLGNIISGFNQQINHISFVGEQLAAGSEEIAATVEEMAKTAENSDGGVQEIVKLTGSVQASLGEITQATSKLNELGGNLQTLMNRFTI